MLLNVLVMVLSISKVYSAPNEKSYSELKSCNLGPLAKEIAGYDTVVKDILNYVRGPFKGKTYAECRKKMKLVLISIQALFGYTVREAKHMSENSVCSDILQSALIADIASHENDKDEIVKLVVEGKFKGKVYDELAKFVDKFGARPSGTDILEQSIDYMAQLTRDENITDIVTEEVKVPHWVRGEEKFTLLKPRVKNIQGLGLGSSVGTPPEGITAEVIVVSSFDEFSNISEHDVKGKIVLFDEKYVIYSVTHIYRTNAASVAAEKGAVATLVRSITPFSISSPHAGEQDYAKNVVKIPSAAIAIEDADLIRRMYDRGEKIEVHIKMSATTYDDKISRNTLVDLKGTERPEKLVIVSGHIDSWDVGQGASDDGGGLFLSWAVPVILQKLNLRPKRTIRSIFWTAEEPGLIGAIAYELKHRNESHNIDFIMESDEGTFAPLGLVVTGTQEARCIIAEVLKLFQSINASTLIESDSPSSDINVIVDTGVPGAGLYNANDRYFWFHHTEGDTMNVEDPDELDLGAAMWAAAAYVIADISVDIPRAQENVHKN